MAMDCMVVAGCKCAKSLYPVRESRTLKGTQSTLTILSGQPTSGVKRSAVVWRLTGYCTYLTTVFGAFRH
jgi:hypothetical protein